MTDKYFRLLRRIKEYIDSKSISVSAFERSLGMSNGIFSKALKRNGAISSDNIEKFFSVYSDVNPEWILLGKGSMLKGNSQDSPSQPSSTVNVEQKKEGEEQMNEELFANQMQQLIDLNKQQVAATQKQMEMNQKQMEMNMKLVEMLQTKTQQPNYKEMLQEIKQDLNLIPAQRPKYMEELELLKQNQHSMQQGIASLKDEFKQVKDVVVEIKKKRDQKDTGT